MFKAGLMNGSFHTKRPIFKKIKNGKQKTFTSENSGVITER